jgi:hypothetical protein
LSGERIIPGTRHATKSIALSFYVDLGPNEWPWPINLNADEFERILNGFNDERLAMFVAGMIDGDGLVRCIFKDNNAYVQVGITACKKCHKSYILNVLRRVIAERFGIAGSIESQRAANVLVFSGEDAIRLLRRVTKYMHHPLKRLRAELILALYDERISLEMFGKLYEQTEYERRAPDVKRSHGLEALAQAAPQTHTHGAKTISNPNPRNIEQSSWWARRDLNPGPPGYEPYAGLSPQGALPGLSYGGVCFVW